MTSYKNDSVNKTAKKEIVLTKNIELKKELICDSEKLLANQNYTQFLDTYFAPALKENKIMAMKILAKLGFKNNSETNEAFMIAAIEWLEEHNSLMLQHTMTVLSKIIGWRPLFQVKKTSNRLKLFSLIRKIFKSSDTQLIENLAKQLPRRGRDFNTSTFVKGLWTELGMKSEKEYRQFLVTHSNPNSLENKMCNNKWNEINYAALSQHELEKHHAAFLRHDKERFSEFLITKQQNAIQNMNRLAALIKDGHSINDLNVPFKHKYPFSFLTEENVKLSLSEEHEDVNIVLNKLWQECITHNSLDTLLPINNKGTLKQNILTIIDTNSSMDKHITNTLTARSVATSLTLFISNFNKGVMKNIYGYANGELKTIDNTLNIAQQYHNINNVDVEKPIKSIDINKTLKSLLEFANKSRLATNLMPKMIVIFTTENVKNTNMNDVQLDMLQQEYAKYGYNLPHIVYWNLSNGVFQNEMFFETENQVTQITGFTKYDATSYVLPSLFQLNQSDLLFHQTKSVIEVQTKILEKIKERKEKLKSKHKKSFNKSKYNK